MSSNLIMSFFLPKFLGKSEAMERLFKYWEKYCEVPQAAKDYFIRHATIRNYEKRNIFSHPEGSTEYWAFVLAGLVEGVYYPEEGKKCIRWFAMPNEYFTSTVHLFTKRIKDVHIEFSVDSTLLLIPAPIAKQGQLQYPAISELFHVLSNKKLNQYRRYVDVIQKRGIDQQYATFRETMTELEAITTNEQQCQYFNFGSGSFYRAKKAYLTRPTKKNRILPSGRFQCFSFL